MRARASVCFGIFAVMALSNVIVPVLPFYAEGSFLQGFIYAAYFLGAFLVTLPAGLLADRYGKGTIMRCGLVLSVISGVALLLAPGAPWTIGARILEGIGAGLFVAASMAYVNLLPDHERMSGFYLASMNGGLVIGLVSGGILAARISIPSAGILLFTGFCVVPALLSSGLRDPVRGAALRTENGDLISVLGPLVGTYRWLWYSALVLVGVTGVITSLYPEFSGGDPERTGLWIAGMSIATIITVLAASHLKMPPVPTIRTTSLLMAAGVLVSFYSPAGILVIGALAGIVMIAQMSFLAAASSNQGAAMGLLSTTSYLGMSLLPFFAGILAETLTFFSAFLITAGAALSVTLTIGRCACSSPGER